MLAPGDIISHDTMCREEGKYLQKGMNFRKSRNSVFLMSRRPDALYTDEIQDDGLMLVYQGHDDRPTPGLADPRVRDQPLELNGKPTDNGKFFSAAMAARSGGQPHIVHVYEKLRPSVWVFRGAFALVDAYTEPDGLRQVCRFKLRLVDERDPTEPTKLPHSRVIPGEVMAAVWKRDGGKCQRCGSTENLHFDHILPFSKGGTSLLESNIQLLCAKHNIAKRDRIGA